MKRANAITLPAYLSIKPRKYITRSGGKYTPDDVALRFALSIRFHNSADALRALARTLVPMVCLEHQPNLNLLSRTKDDDKVFDAALKIINRVCDLMNLAPDSTFTREGSIAKGRPANESAPGEAA